MSPRPVTLPDPGRIDAIEAMLSNEPFAPAAPIGRRDVWRSLAAGPSAGELVEMARQFAVSGPRPLTSDMYLEFSRTGIRGQYEVDQAENRRGLGALVVAECLTDTGEFIPAVQTYVNAICDEINWMMPAHDKELKNFRGEVREIDLRVAMTAWDFAVAIGTLGDRLDEKVRQRALAEIELRAWRPFEDMVAGRSEMIWWMTNTNNWNAVCLAGVTNSSLMLEPSRRRRAEMLAAAEMYINAFLNGFGPDGYCSEGIGYWNYGFGHFLMLSDTVYRATGGGIDLLAEERAQRAAMFPRRIEIAGGTCPAFADCRPGTRPGSHFLEYLARRMGAATPTAKPLINLLPLRALFETILFTFENASSQRTRIVIDQDKLLSPLRSWFDQAGVLVSRPARLDGNSLAAAMKGGHNNEHHNHNDLGSYVVTVGGAEVLCDPGMEVYTARTFGPRRYESTVIGSFGHPVPVVAGQIQQEGPDARARVVEARFDVAEDVLVLDLSTAYQAAGLQRLTRTFRYSRSGACELSVTDEASLAEPANFETAVLTFGKWLLEGKDTLIVMDQDRGVRVRIDTGSAEYEIAAQTLHEDMPMKRLATRIGIRLTAPARDARIRLTISPLADAR